MSQIRRIETFDRDSSSWQYAGMAVVHPDPDSLPETAEVLREIKSYLAARRDYLIRVGSFANWAVKERRHIESLLDRIHTIQREAEAQ